MPSQNTYDVILAGGGIMACSTAYNLLKQDPTLSVLIIERDSTYEKASTTSSDGNTRIQFNVKENILISKFALEVLDRFSEEFATKDYTPMTGFRKQGNLFLVDKAGEKYAKEGIELQQSLGCDSVWLEPSEISDHYPLYRGLEHVVGATFGPNDGTMSPRDILMGYRNKAIELGAVILEAEVGKLVKENAQMVGLQLKSGEVYHSRIIANLTGAWAPILAETVDVDLPVAATKREVYNVLGSQEFDEILPMLLLPTGQFIFHEGENNYVTGGALPDDPVTYTEFGWSRGRFEETMWEGLVTHIPDFDRLKLTGGWAGLYAVNTFDGNAILGEWPELKGYYCANGFSGHGFQQSHAVGRYIAELMLNLTPALDLSVFSPKRILENKPIFENPARLI